ncbi:hypothetical protein BCR39DRAFT_230143 [Naematelia encephala]|uniref:Protein SMG7 n=1 Tax=Naematelia encephala TaxID=71784 RepID=A0A1Y2AYK1_9TREE|nr:hypothetical protein BCR39DRAFT_230143 [Naematelia encephala]
MSGVYFATLDCVWILSRSFPLLPIHSFVILVKTPTERLQSLNNHHDYLVLSGLTPPRTTPVNRRYRSNMSNIRNRPVSGIGGRQNTQPRTSVVRGAADIDREGKAAFEVLREMLRTQLPWTREIEFQRQRTRDLYLTLLFAHPLSPYARSLEPLWHYTTYTLIGSYRELVARTEASLPPPPSGRRRNNNHGAGQNTPAHIELRKQLTRFRQALVSEERFYRGLISRIVAFYGLQSLTRDHLSMLGIPMSSDPTSPSSQDQPRDGSAPEMTLEERREKVVLVYKGLICLGDLERYKEQYSERARKDREGNAVGRHADRERGEERFARSKNYYEIARGLLPNDGSAFNQLAVISTYINDDLLCVYYYFRALAVRQAFKNGEEILDKFLKKVNGEEPSDGGEIRFRKEFLVVVASLYRRTGMSSVGKLTASILPTLAVLLRERQLASETIVKITVIIIGTHWHARSAASIVSNGAVSANGEGGQSTRRRDAEEISLASLLDVATTMFSVSADEIDEAIRTPSTPGMELHQHISAVLRRVLPSLRIISKWLKLNLDYLARFTSPTIASFWQAYRRLLSDLVRLFPISQLPSLAEPLEEDIDMRGFMPLSRGLPIPAGASMNGQNGDTMPEETVVIEQQDVHPNEEQLMRISDLQVDAKLLMQTEAINGSVFASPGYQRDNVSVFTSPRFQHQHDDQDIASVSTETEDDPVNLAMRATLGGSSVDEEEEVREEVDDDEEVIVWGRSTPLGAAPQTTQASIVKPNPAGTSTAYDLLQNLMLERQTSPNQRSRHPAQPQSQLAQLPPQSQAQPHTQPQPRIHSQPQAQASHNPSPPGTVRRGQPGAAADHGSPGLLFGGDQGGSIWTMTREESEKGRLRDNGNNRGLASVAGLWDNPPPPPIGSNGHGPAQHGLWGAPTAPGGGIAGLGSTPVGYPIPMPIPQAGAGGGAYRAGGNGHEGYGFPPHFTGQGYQPS